MVDVRVNGKMLWFNDAKGVGLICTEDGERVDVSRGAFEPGEAPAGRCASRPVVFELVIDEGVTEAMNVRFSPEASGRRARRRHGSRRSPN